MRGFENLSLVPQHSWADWFCPLIFQHFLLILNLIPYSMSRINCRSVPNSPHLPSNFGWAVQLCLWTVLCATVPNVPINVLNHSTLTLLLYHVHVGRKGRTMPWLIIFSQCVYSRSIYEARQHACNVPSSWSDLWSQEDLFFSQPYRLEETRYIAV